MIPPSVQAMVDDPQAPTAPLHDFVTAMKEDDNWWWRIASGHQLNLFEDALWKAETWKVAAMAERDEINDFLMGNGAKAFPFDNMGDTITGRIVDMKKQQQTDMESGDPVYWKNGDPKMMLRITLQTDEQNGDDDEGLRSVYLRGGNPTAVKGKGTSSLVAVKDAVKKSGSDKGIEVGGTLTLQFSGEGEKTNRAYNAPKLYVASYKPPSYAIDIDDMA